MKCPKCGYLGFETGDRCRNCGYDFSLNPPPRDAELTLNQPNAAEKPLADFDLPALSKPSERLTQPLDLDRLFGVESAPSSSPAPAPSDSLIHPAEPQPAEPAAMAVAAASRDSSVLPFDEEALVRPPRPARPPLGVRRTTPESPRGRPRPHRPTRFESSPDLALESPAPDVEAEPDVIAPPAPPVATTPMEPASLPVRLSALAIDTGLLSAVSLAVLVLTLRIAGLAMTWEDIRVLPAVPFIAFLALLSLGYVATFTVAGGQTIGKMLTGARVIGDDGRPVDVAGAVLRALGCALVPLTIGLSYGPVVLSIERRALHDRLAGTRVIRA